MSNVVNCASFLYDYDELVSVRIEISRNSFVLANPPGPLFV